MIAIGLGCRRDCARTDLLSAVHAALAQSGRTLADVHALYIPEFKRDQAVLREAASELGKPLCLLSLSALHTAAPFALSRSARVQAEFGLPSIAETAALAGAMAQAGASTHELRSARAIPYGHAQHANEALCAASAPRQGQLLAPRVVVGGATCALAVSKPVEAP